jgi:hypothetical protein
MHQYVERVRGLLIRKVAMAVADWIEDGKPFPAARRLDLLGVRRVEP